MENQNKMPTCWADLVFDENTSIAQVVGLLNSFNQRLAMLEDNVYIKSEDGRMISVTQFLGEQAQKQMEAQAKAQAEAEAQAKEETPQA